MAMEICQSPSVFRRCSSVAFSRQPAKTASLTRWLPKSDLVSGSRNPSASLFEVFLDCTFLDRLTDQPVGEEQCANFEPSITGTVALFRLQKIPQYSLRSA